VAFSKFLRDANVTVRKPKSPKADQTSTPTPQGHDNYLADVAQRTVLFLDTLLDRGNAYREHLDKGTPPLLK